MLRSLRFEGIIALVDRVDEPYLINGSTELMQALVWPMLDNKFLKHPGMGLKLLLPVELERLVDRQERDFHQRARLDKQNLVRSLAWTGQSLYDLANARLAACASRRAPRRRWPICSTRRSINSGSKTLWAPCGCRGTCSSSCTAC